MHRPTQHVRALLALLAGATIGLSAGHASALQSCTKDADCKLTTDSCHGGTCVPKSKLCTANSDCASYQVCDMTCPHGGSGNATVTEVQPGGTGEASGGSGSSGGSSDGDAPKAGSGGSESGSAGSNSGSAEPESSGGAPAGGAGASTSTGDVACPKTIGVCVAAVEKVVADSQCKAFCAVAAKCGGFGGSSTSSSGSGSTATPVPAPDPGTSTDPDNGGTDQGGSSSGSAGSPSGGGDSDDAGADEEGSSGGGDTPSGAAPAPGDTGDVPKKEDDGKKADANDTAACEFMCSVIKLEKIAPTEFDSAVACTIKAGTQTCDAIETSCKTEFAAIEKAMKANEDALALALGGGWGAGSKSSELTAGGTQPAGETGNGSAGSSDSKGTSNTSGGNGDAASQTSGAAGAAGASGATSGGCTAGRTTTGPAGAALALLALLALAWRRRVA